MTRILGHDYDLPHLTTPHFKVRVRSDYCLGDTGMTSGLITLGQSIFIPVDFWSDLSNSEQAAHPELRVDSAS
jgi:hypothetical protein